VGACLAAGPAAASEGREATRLARLPGDSPAVRPYPYRGRREEENPCREPEGGGHGEGSPEGRRLGGRLGRKRGKGRSDVS